MNFSVDWDLDVIKTDAGDIKINSTEAFDIISDAYFKIGWQNKHVYSFTWLGRPIIQHPEDIVRAQELVYNLRPDFIIETGIAHGGSLIFYASLCRAMEKGRVIGVDIDIREHNRTEIDKSPVRDLITMYEGSSTDPEIISKIKETIKTSKVPNPVVLVILDACHTKEHALKELEEYSKFVSLGSYIISCDGGIMEMVSEIKDALKSEPDWKTNNPKKAAEEFADSNGNFEICNPEFNFNEGTVKKWHSYWGGGILRRNA